MSSAAKPARFEQELVDNGHRAMQLGLCIHRLSHLLPKFCEETQATPVKKGFLDLYQTVMNSSRTQGVTVVLAKLGGSKTYKNETREIKSQLKKIPHEDFTRALTHPLSGMDLLGPGFCHKNGMSRIQNKGDNQFHAEFSERIKAIEKLLLQDSFDLLNRVLHPETNITELKTKVENQITLYPLFRKTVEELINSVISTVLLPNDWAAIRELPGYQVGTYNIGAERSPLFSELLESISEALDSVNDLRPLVQSVLDSDANRPSAMRQAQLAAKVWKSFYVHARQQKQLADKIQRKMEQSEADCVKLMSLMDQLVDEYRDPKLEQWLQPVLQDENALETLSVQANQVFEERGHRVYREQLSQAGLDVNYVTAIACLVNAAERLWKVKGDSRFEPLSQEVQLSDFLRFRVVDSPDDITYLSGREVLEVAELDSEWSSVWLDYGFDSVALFPLEKRKADPRIRELNEAAQKILSRTEGHSSLVLLQVLTSRIVEEVMEWNKGETVASWAAPFPEKLPEKIGKFGCELWKLVRLNQRPDVIEGAELFRHSLSRFGWGIDMENIDDHQSETVVVPWVGTAEVPVTVELEHEETRSIRYYRYLLIPQPSNWFSRFLVDASSWLPKVQREFSARQLDEIYIKLRDVSEVKNDEGVVPHAVDVLNLLAQNWDSSNQEAKLCLEQLAAEINRHAHLVPPAVTASEIINRLATSSDWLSSCCIVLASRLDTENQLENLRVLKFRVVGKGTAQLCLQINEPEDRLSQLAVQALTAERNSLAEAEVFNGLRVKLFREFVTNGRCNQDALRASCTRLVEHPKAQTVLWEELKGGSTAPWVQLIRECCGFPDEATLQQRLATLRQLREISELSPEAEAAYGFRGDTDQLIRDVVVPQIAELNELLSQHQFDEDAQGRLQLLRNLLEGENSGQLLQPDNFTLCEGQLTCELPEMQRSKLRAEFSELDVGRCLVRKLGVTGQSPAEIVVSAGPAPNAHKALTRYVSLLRESFNFPAEPLSLTASDWAGNIVRGKKEQGDWIWKKLLPAIGQILLLPDFASLDNEQSNNLYKTHLNILKLLNDYTRPNLDARLIIVQRRAELGSRWRYHVELSEGREDWPEETKAITIRPIVVKDSDPQTVIHQGEVKLYT